MDIKDVLKSGDATADELLAQFQKDLMKAQREVDAEKAKEAAEAKAKASKDANLEKVRNVMIDAVMNYLVALGVVDDDLDDEDRADLVKAIKSAEKEMIEQMNALNELKEILGSVKPSHTECHSKSKDKPKMNDDEVLAKFLAQIM